MLLLVLALQESLRTSCACGAWIEPKDATLVIGFKTTTLAVVPIYRGKSELMGKPLDLTRPNDVICPCGRKSGVPAWFTLPVGSFTCGACKGGWTVTASTLTGTKSDGSTVASFPVAEGLVRPKGKWLQKLPEEIDLIASPSIDCLCGGGGVTLHQDPPPNPGGTAPKTKPKAGKKLDEVACPCGGSALIHEGLATLQFNGKKIADIPVSGGAFPAMGFSVVLTQENKIPCACGKEVTVPILIR